MPGGVRHLADRSLPELAHGLREGGTTADELLAVLEERFVRVEPEIEAFLPEPGRFERLRREAGELVRRYPDPRTRPPLFAVPVAVKDVFGVSGFATRAGSRLPPEAIRVGEAAAVVALKRAGALVLGKTVTTEFAYFVPGPTRNPRRPDHTPGGSSSGSAAAVAAGLAPLALGTQTIGSVLRPASFCGVVGVKPTYDRIRRDGLFPLAPSLDHVGFFAADVGGAELAARVLCPGFESAPPVERPRLAVPVGPYLERAEPAMLRVFRDAVERLVAAGVEVEEVAALADFDAVEARHRALLAAEAAVAHRELYARFAPLYGTATAELVERGWRVRPTEVAAAREGRDALAERLAAALEPAGLDAWLSPAATGPAPAGLLRTGDPVMNLPWTYAGVPAIALPFAETTDGLPLGLQLAGRRGGDEALFTVARRVAAALAGGER